MISKLLAGIKQAAGSNRTGIELIGKNETFKHQPGKLTAVILMPPNKEDQFILRRKDIVAARSARVSAATTTYTKATSAAQTVRDISLDEAERIYRHDLRALFVQFNQVSDEVPAPAPTQPLPQRRRIEIPDKLADVVKERSNGDPA